MADLVVGSGPSGIAVAAALLQRGRDVVMIDGGVQPDKAARARREALAGTDPSDWPGDVLDELRAAQNEATDGRVRRFGSDFAQLPASRTFSDADECHLLASHAVGGLSNVWGAAFLPNSSRDMAGWPVSADDMRESFAAVARLVPVSATPGPLDALFDRPPSPGGGQVAPSAQAGALLDRLARKRRRLEAAGIVAGQARVAVAQGCRQCGLCLMGCPWGLIWSAADTLGRFRESPRFSYKPGPPVVRFEDATKGVSVFLADGSSHQGERLFLAAGVLETSRIMLASRGSNPPAMTMRESPHGFLPMLHRWRAPRRPDAMPLTTLPQVFVEMDAADVSPNLIHAQLYSWNEQFDIDLAANYASRLPGSAPLFRALARRLIVAQVFLHSRHGPGTELALGPDGRLLARVRHNAQTAPTFDAATRRLARGLRAGGLHALGFARRLGPPGSSFHAGATLPMTKEPSGWQSDALGRPAGLEKVHVVDASVLPEIAATTITCTVMANAHRIGCAAPD